MKAFSRFVGLFVLAAAGCYTVSETEYPQVSVTPAPSGNSIRVKLMNFRTGLHKYVPVEGHETMAGAESGVQLGMASQTSEAGQGGKGSMRATASANIVGRTVRELKRQGYVIDKKTPQYVISLGFSGPQFPDDDVWCQVRWLFGTLFTAQKEEVTWTANLKVYDSTAEKVLFEKSYEQYYSAVVWGPVPFLSPAFSEKTKDQTASSWAITALADTAIADATAFISGQQKK